MGGELVNDFSKLSNSPWESRRPPLGDNIDRCIILKPEPVEAFHLAIHCLIVSYITPALVRGMQEFVKNDYVHARDVLVSKLLHPPIATRNGDRLCILI